jgi:hypothetical protein
VANSQIVISVKVIQIVSEIFFAFEFTDLNDLSFIFLKENIIIVDFDSLIVSIDDELIDVVNFFFNKGIFKCKALINEIGVCFILGHTVTHQ